MTRIVTGRIRTYVSFGLDFRPVSAFLEIHFAAIDGANVALLEIWRLFHRRDFLCCRIVVLVVEKNNAVVGRDKIQWHDLSLLFRARFRIGELNFEDRAPGHAGDACGDHAHGQRNVAFDVFIIPFGAPNFGRDRFFVLRVKKRIGRERRKGQAGATSRGTVVERELSHVKRNRKRVDTARKKLSV